MVSGSDALPDDVEALKAALLAIVSHRVVSERCVRAALAAWSGGHRWQADHGIIAQRRDGFQCHVAGALHVLYRDGLIIALLALRPLRMRTFAVITLWQHLSRRDGAWCMTFAAEDTKTRQPMEMVFPEALVPALGLYLEHYRPVLLVGKSVPGQVRPPTEALWIAKGGQMMGQSAIQFQIMTHIRISFGIAPPPPSRSRTRSMCASSRANPRPLGPCHGRGALQPGRHRGGCPELPEDPPEAAARAG